MKRKAINSSKSAVILSGLNDVIEGVAIDVQDDVMFWISRGFIYTSTLNSREIKKLKIQCMFLF